MRANEGLAWMWLPANREIITAENGAPGETMPWIGIHP